MGCKINIHAKKAAIDRQAKTAVAAYLKAHGHARFWTKFGYPSIIKMSNHEV
jgi:hypothetical protein